MGEGVQARSVEWLRVSRTTRLLTWVSLIWRSVEGVIDLPGVLFGATILAAATSLPEVSPGLTSVKNEDYQLAASDIFGSNAFLPSCSCSPPCFPARQWSRTRTPADIYLTALGMLLTLVYPTGLLFCPNGG